MDHKLQQPRDVMRLARLGTFSLLSLLLLVPACDGDSQVDAGVDTGPDPRSDSDGSVGADAGSEPEAPGLPGTCYDGVDNDGDRQLDCEDPECGMDPVCCVGSAACCPSAPEATVRFTVPETCTGALSECDLGSSFVAFGAVDPDFEAGGLIPQGGSTYGGVALGPAIDPRAVNVSLRVGVTVPTARCVDCIDAAGVGFFESIPAPGERGAVRLGVLINGSREEAQVIVADRVVARQALTTAAELEVRIELTADGSATITGLAETVTLEAIALPASLSPVVFGRTDNRAPGESAIGVASAVLQLDRCDVPSALVRRADPVLPASSTTWAPTALGQLAVVDVAEETEPPAVRAIFADAGELLRVGLNGSGELVGRSGPPDAVFSPSGDIELFRAPWLTREGSLVRLYFVTENAGGGWSVRRSVAGLDLDFSTIEEVGLPPEVMSVDGLTVWPGDVDGVWHMIARVDIEGDPSVLAALRSTDDGRQFSWAQSPLERSIIRRPTQDDTFAIDRDEVASPALVQVGSTLRLYYAARRGGRWSIGLLVSQDGAAWRPLGAVLEGDDVGFDGLGVLHPAPLVSPEGSVQLYYVGTDGTTNRIGRSGPAGTLGE